MKTKNLAFKILAIAMICVGFVLLCAGMAGCGKDEPDSKLGSVVPNSTVPMNADGSNKFYMENFFSENNTPMELDNGTLFRFMATPIAEYKLYKLGNGKLTDSGLTKKISALNIINMVAGKMIFNYKNHLTISSCLNTFPQNTTQTLDFNYTYDNGFITIDANETTKLTHVVFNPVSTTKRPPENQPIWYSQDAETEEDFQYYIIAEEIPEVMNFINDINNFIIKYGKNKMLMIPWTQNGSTFCTIYPDDNICRAFCIDVVIPFLSSMFKYAEKDYLISNSVFYLIGREMTKQNIDCLRKYIEQTSTSGTFVYTTGYQFVK